MLNLSRAGTPTLDPIEVRPGPSFEKLVLPPAGGRPRREMLIFDCRLIGIVNQRNIGRSRVRMLMTALLSADGPWQ
jgi:hypothetical protein